MRRIGQSICIILLFSFAASCATMHDKRGRFHKVRTGETIWSIARAYRIDAQALAEYNNIEDPAEVVIDMSLYIPARPKRDGFKRLPGESGPRAARRGRSERMRPPQQREKEEGESIHADHARFSWPVDGSLLSGFGYRNGRRHDGIDIKAGQGTPIQAADEGRVVFSGKMRGYGNLILVRHEDDFFTAYAHNSQNLAKKNQAVKKGEVIGKVGRTGRATGPHLHFEVRHGQRARNPLFFLPKHGKDAYAAKPET